MSKGEYENWHNINLKYKNVGSCKEFATSSSSYYILRERHTKQKDVIKRIRQSACQWSDYAPKRSAATPFISLRYIACCMLQREKRICAFMYSNTQKDKNHHQESVMIKTIFFFSFSHNNKWKNLLPCH